MPTLIKAILPEIFAILLCLSCAYIGYVKGVAKCEIAHAKVQINGVKEHGKIENKIMSLDDADLDRQLSKWVR